MMELPRPRPFGTEGRKATHDFLSLCSHSSLHQDPRPPSQENFPKTRDFFGKTSAKDETTGAMASSVERPPPPAAPPPPPAHSVEHILPGGIGTYSISHISYFDQKLPKPEASLFTVAQASSTDRTDENSNCSSYTNGGFTLWDESAAKKGKTGKENVQTTSAREAEVKLGPWASSERPSQSSSNNNHRNSINCSLSSSQPPGPKNKSFMEMIRSAKSGSHQEEEFDDDDGEFVLKKETSPVPKGELRVNVDGKSNSDQKANTPRSKHSATEQRRRSKINDRFQTLRSLIPNSDQKRDKASFLLEVIEYIQYLQEKVNKYEGSFQQWSPEPAKMVPLRNGQRLADGFVDQSRGINIGTSPAMVFATKVDENHVVAPPANYRSSQNPMEPEISSATAFKAMEHHPGMTNRAVLFPMSLQPNISTCPRTSGLVAIADSDLEKKAPQPLSQISQIASWSNERASLNGKLKEQELTIEGGTISISNVYSQGLLNTLTQALQSSGVDLSQASISVQIELGKQSNGRVAAPVPKDIEARNQGITRPRVASEDSNQALKKLKTSKS